MPLDLLRRNVFIEGEGWQGTDKVGVSTISSPIGHLIRQLSCQPIYVGHQSMADNLVYVFGKLARAVEILVRQKRVAGLLMNRQEVKKGGVCEKVFPYLY